MSSIDPWLALEYRCEMTRLRREQMQATAQQLELLHALRERRKIALIEGPALDYSNDPIGILISQDISKLETKRDALLDEEITERYGS